MALRYGLVRYLDKLGSKSSGELVSDANFLKPYGDRFRARPRVHCHPVKAEFAAAKRMFWPSTLNSLTTKAAALLERS
jgi:hypothetical protein